MQRIWTRALALALACAATLGVLTSIDELAARTQVAAKSSDLRAPRSTRQNADAVCPADTAEGFRPVSCM